MQAVPKACVFAFSTPWKSAVGRIIEGITNLEQTLPKHGRLATRSPIWGYPKISWALDSEGCLLEVAHSPNAIAVLELTSATVVRDCELVRQATQFDTAGPVFAVGDETIAPYLPLIRGSGFADCSISILQATQFAKHIRKYLTNRPVANESIEKWVQNHLPF